MSNFDEGAVAKRAADPSAGMGSRGTQRRVPPRQLLPDALWSLLAASGGVHRSGAMRFGGMSMGTSVVFSAVLRFVLVLMCGMIGVAWSADMPPLVAAPAMATPANVAGRTTKLTVLGADDGGAANLRYAWSAEGPALVTFSSTNDTASGRTVTATFRAVGDYHLTATITDGSGQAITSTVPVTVSATLTSLAISPSTAAVNPLATRAFAATAKNQFGVAMSDVSFTWTAAGSGVVDAFGLFTAGGEPGAASVTVSAGEKTAAAAIRVNAAPTVATAAAIDTPVVHGTTAVCTIQGGDDASVDELTYTWSAAGPASVSFAPRSSRQGETTTATFRAAGEYVITATITDKEGLATTSTTVATVLQTAVSLAVSPSRNVVVNPGLTKPFVAAVRDQFNDLMVPQPIVEWDVTTGNGSIGSDGVYVAGDPGYATITASVGTVRGGATLRINAPPTVVQAVATDTTTITGLTAVFTVQGADDVDPSLLSYSWAASGPKSVSFSPRTGVTAASTTATFTCAGAYTITSTIVDKQGLKTTSSLAVHVLQVPTSFGLHPASAILNPRAAKAFVVQVRDQYQATIAGAVAPAATWSATGGSIDGAGRYVAGATPGSGTVLAVVETDAGPVTLEAVVRINAPPSIVSPAATSGPNPTDVGTIPLVVLGADDGGAANLRYVWSVIGGNASGVMFDGATQNTTAAQHIVATVPGPGSYQFRVLVRDAQGLSATSDVTVAVQHAPGASDPPRVPTPTLVISAGLSGDRHATVGDEVWWFTNQPQITVTMLPGITDDADVSETRLLASGGDVVQRDSTTWDIVSLPESRIDLSAEVRVVKNGQSAIGATTSPTIIISDRTPPRLRWRMPGSTGPVGQGLPSDGGNVLRLCGEASDVERIRSTYGWLVWAKSDFAIEADIDDLAGVADTATPIATVGGGAPRAALVPDPANPQMRILRLDHFGGVPDTIEVSDDLTVSQAEVASLRVVLPDRCGNALSADQLSMMVKTTPAAIRAGYVPWNRDDFPSDIGVWPPNAAVDLSAVCLVATAADVVAVEQRVGAMAYPARRLTASPATCAQLAGAGPVLWALAQPGWASGLDDTIVVVARTMDVVGNVSGDQHIRATRTWHQVALPHPGDDETLTQVVAAHDADIQTIRHYDFWNVNRVEWWLGVDVAMPLYGTRVFGDDIQSGFIEMRQWSHLSLDPNPVAVVTTRSIPARIDLREQPLSGASIGVVFMPGEYQPVRRFISGASDGRGRFHQMAGLAPTYSIEADNPYLFFDKDGEALRGHVVDDAARFVDVDENGQYVFPANWPKRVSPTRQWRGFELRVGEELPVESRRMVERYMRCMPGVSEEYNFFERYPFRAAYMIEEREQISGDPMDGLYRWNAYLDVPRIASVPASWSTSPLRLERVRVADRGVLTGPWREHEADRIAGADGRLDVVVGRDLPGGYYRLQHDAMAGGPETRIAQQCGFRSLNLVKVDRDVVVAGAVSSCEVSAAFLDSLPMPGSALLPPGSAVRIYASDRRALAEGRLRESGIGIGAWMQELRQSLEESVGLIGASSGTAHASVEDALLRACEMSAVRGVLMPHGVDSWEMLVQQWFDVAPDASLLEQGLTRQMIAVSADEVRVADDLMRGSEDALLSYRRTHGGWNASAAADAARRRGDAALAATVAVSRLGHGRGIYAMAVDDALRPYRDRLNAIETNLQELAVQRNAMCEMILDLQDDVIRQVHDVFNDETNIHEMTNMVYSDGDHVLYAYDEWFYGGYRIEDELFLSMWDDIAVHARALQDERDGIHADERYLVLKRAEAHAKSAITPYAVDTSSVIDAFSSRSYLPLPLESRVSVIGLHMRADEPSSPLSQVLIAHMDVGSRASGMYDLSISCGLIGANGAHRMKEALAVINIAHETQSNQNVTQLKKSFSAPALTASVGSTSISGKQVTLSFSGSVQDTYAGLVQNSALKAIHVFRGSEHVGDISLQVANDGATDWAPYAKHFTFSGSVTSDAWVGTETMVLLTDTNEMGAHGRVEVPVTLSGTQPVPDLVAQVSITTGAGLSPTVADTITVTSPDVAAGGTAQAVVLTETGPDTREFTGPGEWLATIGTYADGKASCSVSVGGSLRYVGDFVVGGNGELTRTDAWVPAITGPTTLAFGLTWDGAWASGGTLRLALPSAFGAVTPLVLAGSGSADGTGSWSGVFNGNSVIVTARAVQPPAAPAMAMAAAPASAGNGSIVTTTINGSVVSSMTVNDSSAAGSANASYTVSDPYEVASYSTESVGSAESANRAMGNAAWEPYRIRVDVPEALGDAFVTGRTWTVAGQDVAVEKINGKWYVKDTTSGKPAVYVDPAVTPAADPRGNDGQGEGAVAADDPPLPEGWAAYHGEAAGVRVVVYQRVGKTPPQSINMNVQFDEGTDRVKNVWGPDNLKDLHWTVTVVGLHANKYAKDGTGDNSIVCAIRKEQATAGTLVGKAGASDPFGTLVLAGYLKTFDAGPACWEWKAAGSSEDDQSIGWQWTGAVGQEITSRPALWTLPDEPGSGGETKVSITKAVAKALGEEDIPLPSNDYDQEKKRIVLSNITALVGKGAVSHFEVNLANTLYNWMLAHLFKAPVAGQTTPLIDDKFLTYRALNIQKVVDAFNAERATEVAAANAKNKERNQYGEWTLAGHSFSSPEAWVTIIDSASNAVDPFGAAVTLAAGEPLVPVAEKATWCGVGLSVGFLIIDRIPFAKAARKGKLLFRRVASLPEAIRPARKLAKEELVIVGKKVKNLVERDANTINQAYLAKGQKAPYIPNSKVVEFTTDEPVTMVRFHGPPNQKGDWFTMLPESRGVATPEDARQLLCLKRSPSHFSVVQIPAGVRIRKGGVRKQPEWGCPNDGGTQYELILPNADRGKIDFGVPKPMAEWSNP